MGEDFLNICAIALLLASFATSVWCIAVAIIRKRFSIRLLMVLATAICVFVALTAAGYEAARQNEIRLNRQLRVFYQDNRDTFEPEYYDQHMRDLDAEAERLGIERK